MNRAPSTPLSRIKPAAARLRALPLLWSAVAVSFPTFAMADWRLQIPFGTIFIYVPLPVVMTVLAAAATLSRRMGEFRPGVLRPVLGPFFNGAVALFVLLHFVSVFWAPEPNWALRDSLKLLGSVLSFYLVLHSFPARPEALQAFWRTALIVSAILFGALIYRHLVVFQSSFLGAHFDSVTRQNRNQLLWYLVFVLPFALTWLISGRVRVLQFAVGATLLVGWVYGGSRGAWISVVVGVSSIALIASVRRGIAAALTSVIIAVSLLVSIPLLVQIMETRVGELDASRRFRYLWDPSSVPELQSFESRTGLIEQAIETFRTAPILGIGVLADSGATHNDFAAMLLQLGFVGFVLFVMVLWRFATPAVAIKPDDDWTATGARMGLVSVLVSLMAINGYQSPLLWVFCALALLTLERPQPAREAMSARAVRR